MASPSAGVPFGKYLLQSKLATGGMAELFLARLKNAPDKLVVLKRVLPEYSKETEFLAMFINEAKVAAQLNHPNIIRIFDLGHEAGQYFIAMEYIDGCDLSTAVKQLGGKVKPEVGAKIGAALADALYYANRMTGTDGKPLDIVHRDVTPGNVMLGKNGAIKLVDFGIAKASVQIERTRPGVVKGKFRYMSPEQLDELALDGRSDLFSLGVLLYEITTGDKLFEAKQIIDTLKAVKFYTPPAPHTKIPGFPRPLSDVIMRALEKNRDKRYRNGRDMAAELEAWLAQTPDGGDMAPVMRRLFPDHRPEPAAPERTDRTDWHEETDPQSSGVITARGRYPSKPDNSTDLISDEKVKKLVAEADRRAGKGKSSVSNEVNTTPQRRIDPPRKSVAALPLGGDDEDDDGDKTSLEMRPRGRGPSNPVADLLPPPVSNRPPTRNLPAQSQASGPRKSVVAQKAAPHPVAAPLRPARPLEDFGDETDGVSAITETATGSRPRPRSGMRTVLAVFGLVLICVACALVGYLVRQKTAAAPAPVAPTTVATPGPETTPAPTPEAPVAPEATTEPVPEPKKTVEPAVAHSGKVVLSGRRSAKVLDGEKVVCTTLSPSCVLDLAEGDHSLTVVENGHRSPLPVKAVSGQTTLKRIK